MARPGDHFGQAVALAGHGNRVVGARNNDGTKPDAGHVRVYELVGRLPPPPPRRRRATAPRLSAGTRVAVGYPGGIGVYDRATGAWSYAGRLQIPTPPPAALYTNPLYDDTTNPLTSAGHHTHANRHERLAWVAA